MATGEITRLNTEQGIGYIREHGEAEEVSFNAMALLDGVFSRLSVGQEVEFDHKPFSNAPSKTRAINVRLVRMTPEGPTS